MLISIVICTYNRDKFILQAIKSIENQQLANVAFELIVINNNSTDNTDAICKSYATTAAIP
ncbi:MAG: glycosyltransferase, partial [Saprospiraceae bacterium]